MKQDVMLPVRVVVHAGRRLRPSDCPFRPSACHLLSDCYSFFSVSRSNRNRALRRVNYNRPPCGVKAIRTHRHLHTNTQTDFVFLLLCPFCGEQCMRVNLLRVGIAAFLYRILPLMARRVFRSGLLPPNGPIMRHGWSEIIPKTGGGEHLPRMRRDVVAITIYHYLLFPRRVFAGQE